MPTNTRYFMYLRKSQESEDRQVLSIPAQEHALRDLAARRGLVVIGEPFREARTAKEPGRPLFNAMLDRLKKREADGIICWKLDRLARNPVDAGALSWGLTKKDIAIIVTSESDYTGSGDDKFFMSIMLSMATKFIDDLSVNVKRGNEEALRQGLWPGQPKFGYLRDHVTKLLEPDPVRFAPSVALWERRIQGEPIADLFAQATAWCLTTPPRGKVGGRPIVIDQLYRMFHDPFYAGVMEFGGSTHPGRHQPMVSWSQFQAVQEGFAQTKVVPSSRPKFLDFTYRGLITCGSCGALVTAEHTTNPYRALYTYYHCCRKNRRFGFCPERSLEERALEDQLEKAIASVQIPISWAQRAMDQLERDLRSESRARESLRETLCAQQTAISAKRRRLDDLLIDGHIDTTLHHNRADELLGQEREIVDQLAALDAPDPLIEQFRDSISLVTSAEKVFEHAEPAQRREMARKLFSNLTLKDRTLLYEAKKVLTLLREGKGLLDRCALRDHVRTLGK